MASNTIKDVTKASPVTAEQVGTVIKSVVVKEPIITQKIYVGPNILGLPKYTVIETDFTEHIKSFIAKCSAIEKLFVPIADMAETEKRAAIKGTLEYRNYQKVSEFKAGKGDK